MPKPRQGWVWAALLLGWGCADRPGTEPDANAIATDARIDGGLDVGGPDLGFPEDAELPDFGPADVGEPDAFVDAGVDAGTICDEPPVATLTATLAAQNRAQYLDQVVLLEGTLGQGSERCASATCPPETPCCNDCSAEVRLEALVTLRSSPCLSFAPGCQGDTCGLVCRPALLGIPGHYLGRLREQAGQLELELFQVRP